MSVLSLLLCRRFQTTTPNNGDYNGDYNANDDQIVHVQLDKFNKSNMHVDVNAIMNMSSYILSHMFVVFH